MRKTAIAFLALGLSAALFTPASAIVHWSETFAYADGGLVAGSGGNWATHSGTGTDIQVAAGVAVGDMAAAPDDNRTFAAQDTTAATYACFRVMIPSIVGAPRTNYFAHLKDGTTTNFVCRVFVAPQGSTFSFGLSLFSGTMAVQWPTALNYDQWYTIAIKYDPTPALDVCELWVDPVDESSAKITTSAVAPSFLVSAFAMRQSSTGTGTVWKYNVDNIMVGSDFLDLCPNPTPTRNSTWGQVKSIYR
jgi:hypothetical protein